MKDERNYLLHIRDAIERILLYTRDGREVFLGDIKTQDAVIRNLEIIGEAVKHLSDATTQRRLSICYLCRRRTILNATDRITLAQSARSRRPSHNCRGGVRMSTPTTARWKHLCTKR